MGLQEDSRLAPGAPEGASVAGGALISQTAADQLGVRAGDEVTINGRTVAVGGAIEDSWYSHTPVLYLPLETWATVTHAAEGTSTVLVAGTAPDAGHAPAAAGETTTVATEVDGALSALAAGVVPVQVDMAAVAIPVAVTVVLGLIASVAAVWRTCRVDPLVALGGG